MANKTERKTEPFNDRELSKVLRAAIDGNRSAFAAVLEAHYDLIYRIAFKYLRNPDHAEDIAQETCVKLARKLNTYRFDAKFTTWLYRLTVNTAKDWQRKAYLKHEKSWPEGFDIGASAPSPERQTATRELLGLVETLPKKLRDTVVLVFRDGLSHGQAASALGCAETTISWRIHEARKTLSSLSDTTDTGPRHA